MTARQVLINLGKLILCSAACVVGILLGGMLASLLTLATPMPPQGMDVTMTGIYLMAATPLLAFALALVAHGLGGNIVSRTLMLAFLMWIAYTINTQLEASIFSAYAKGFWYAAVSGLMPALPGGSAAAVLFPSKQPSIGVLEAFQNYFSRRPIRAWAWRLPLAAVAFMLIYFAFGMMVVPFTAQYYEQSMFGLVMPTINQILPILFVRSVLFSLICLPVVVMWQKSNLSLFWRLGLALFVLVGLIYMLISTWLPLYVRFPHALEIFADEMVYAGVLVLLLGKPRPATHPSPNVIGERMPT